MKTIEFFKKSMAKCHWCFILPLLLIFSPKAIAQDVRMNPQQIAKFNLLKESMPDLRINWNPVLNSPTTISRISTDALVLNPNALQTYLTQNFGVFYNIQQSDDWRINPVQQVNTNFKKVLVEQQFRGLRVYGGQLNLSIDNENQLKSLSGKWIPVSDISTQAALTEEQAIARVKAFISEQHFNGASIPASVDFKPSESELLIFNPDVYRSSNKLGRSYLAYKLVFQTSVFFVDAQNGEVLTSFSEVHHAKDRNTFQNACNSGGTQVLDESGAVGTVAANAEATNAHNFAGQTYDYFFSAFGRDSYDGAGGTIVTNVNGVPALDLVSIIACAIDPSFCCNDFNAVWHPVLEAMYFGDGGTDDNGRQFAPFSNALDIVAHELTHGVTTTTANLDYNGESGAINEAVSDIFACMIDLDWQIAEDIILGGIPTGAMRNLADPTNGGSYDTSDPIPSVRAGNQPHHTDHQYTGSSDAGGVHINSGIINHAAYLLSEGGTHSYSNITVQGIGRDAVAEIFYQALTVHLGVTSNFQDLRNFCLTSVDELFPGDAAKYASTWNAFLAVGICDSSDPASCVPYAPIESRDPVTIALVLDYSNSMNGIAGSGSRPKLDVLKDAVEIFLNTWEIFAVPGDQVGIVYFDSDVSPTTMSLQPLIGNVSTIVSQVRSRPTGTYTAMGGGLKVGLDGLSGTSHPAVILFTNGIQNVNPLVKKSGGGSGPYQFLNGSSAEAYGGTSSISPAPGTNLGSYGVPIHCIGIGRAIGDAYHMLLEDIRNETGGQLHLTDEPDVFLREFYLNDLVTALSLNTLELVDHQTGRLSAGGNFNHGFDLDGGMNRAAFAVHWVGDTPNGYDEFHIIAPDGKKVQPTRWQKGDYYSIAVFDFPYMTGNIQLDPRGEWKIFSKGRLRTARDYQVSVLVDEKEIHYDFKAETIGRFAGESVLLTARVTGTDDLVMKNLSSARVKLLKPGESLGNVWSKTPWTGTFTQSDETANEAVGKLFGILEDKSVAASLKPVESALSLNDNGVNGDQIAGDGIYSLDLKNVDAPGSYQFHFSVTGNDTNLGPFKRVKTIGGGLRLKADPDQTRYTTTFRSGDLNVIDIIITPIDANGYLLGPGHSSVINISANGGTVSQITDNLDGSYAVSVSSSGSPGTVPLTIDVFGVEIYNGPANAVGGSSVSKLSLSLHAGTAIPLGGFSTNNSPGLAITADIEYFFKPNYALEILGGYYGFGNDSTSHIIGIDLYGKGYIPIGSFAGYYAAGVGGYFPQNQDPAFGISLGAGIYREINPQIRVGLSGYYHKLFTTQDSDFFAGQLGIHFRLGR